MALKSLLLIVLVSCWQHSFSSQNQPEQNTNSQDTQKMLSNLHLCFNKFKKAQDVFKNESITPEVFFASASKNLESMIYCLNSLIQKINHDQAEQCYSALNECFTRQQLLIEQHCPSPSLTRCNSATSSPSTSVWPIKLDELRRSVSSRNLTEK